MLEVDLFSDRGSTEPPGDLLLVVGFAVPEHSLRVFDDWYETEHAVLLLGAADWLRVRRYVVRSATGIDWTHVAVHDLASLDALDSPERAAARDEPKRQQFLAEKWYQRSSRWLGRGPG